MPLPLQAHVRRMGAAYLVLGIALLSTVLVYVGLQRQLRLRQQARLRQASEGVLNALDLHLRAHIGLLQAIRGLYLANPAMSEQQWKNFFKTFQLHDAFPGLHDVGLVLRVPAADRKKHVASLRQRGFPNYHLHPEREAKDVFPLIYVQQAKGERGVDVIGLDVGADPLHQQTMNRARDAGLPISTGKIPLPKNGRGRSSEVFTVYLPVYAGEETPSTLEERRATLRGFVVATYLPENLWAGITGSGAQSLLDLEIYEGDEMNDRTLLFDENRAPHAQNDHYSESLQMTVFGHLWTLYFSTLPAFELDSKRYLTLLALISGIVISLLLFGIAWSEASSRAASDRLTAELQRSENSLRAANEQLQLKVLESNRAQKELARAHRAAQTEQERLLVTLRSIGDAVLTTDIEGRVLLVNPAAEALIGLTWAEACGLPLSQVLQLQAENSEHPAPLLERVLQAGEIVTSLKGTMVHPRDRGKRTVSMTATPIRAASEKTVGAVLVARDITEQQRVEAELLNARKLESLGVLASGLAHEFNTLLTGILGNVSVARMFAAEATNVDERLSHAEKACLRAQELTERLVTFSKSGPPASRPVPVIDLLNDTANLAVRGSACRCEFTHPQDLWPVRVDEAQICQVIYDLVTNAAEAMPQGGVIELGTRNVTLSSRHTLQLPPGNYVQISVRDHGAGIAPEYLSRVFDPYFTTKQGGSGLALAAAYFALQRHHGLILAESEPGQGTTFRLYLPAAAVPLPAFAELVPALPGVQGRILLMEDDPLILNLGAIVLRRLGYDVLLAKDGEETLRRWQEERAAGQPIAAVILDLTVQGGMGGAETMKRLLSLDPAVKGIATSALDDPVMSDCRRYGFLAAITKPFHASELAKVLQSLDG